MIPFNVPPFVGSELIYVGQAIENQKICGDGAFTQQCHKWLCNQTGAYKALLTTSCTHALEMAALLLDIQPGDEVIMPSYTFVSTANAFVLRGAKIVFIDIRPDTMNMDESLIEAAVTPKTKAIVPVHYAGVACEMNAILAVAEKYGLFVVEDAAQAVMSYYHGRPLGSIGHMGCYSFHETKNYSMGEGGALLLRDDRFAEQAEIIREKGTNRSRFLKGQVDKYTWVDKGSSYLPSDMNAAFLYAQMECAKKINDKRLLIWNLYYDALSSLKDEGLIELPHVPEQCLHNAHMFYIKVKNIEQRTYLIDRLKQLGVQAVFHYVPLHSSPAGQKFGRFHGEDRYTTSESNRLLRLPMFYALQPEDVMAVTDAVKGVLKA